jgi:hypothetical protein
VFYLSRGEQLALVILVLGLLAGGGLLTYERGVRAGAGMQLAPRVTEARTVTSPAAADSLRPARACPTCSAPPALRPAGRLSLNTPPRRSSRRCPESGEAGAAIIEHRRRRAGERARFTSVDQYRRAGIGPKRLAAAG